MFFGEFFCAQFIKLQLVIGVTSFNVKVCDVSQVLFLIVGQLQTSSFGQVHKLVYVRHSLFRVSDPKCFQRFLKHKMSMIQAPIVSAVTCKKVFNEFPIIGRNLQSIVNVLLFGHNIFSFE